MKTIQWLCSVCVVALLAPAAMGEAKVMKGANELALSGMVDFQSDVGTEFMLDLRYGHFFVNRLSVGTKVTMQNNKVYNHYGMGLFSEYNFGLPKSYKPLFGNDLVPFLGVAVEYRHTKIFDSKDGAVVLGGEGGLKFFLTESTAISLSLLGEIASDEIYADDDEATNRDLSLRVGMRLYF